MTDIEAKALALVNEVEREEGEKELTRRIMRGLIMDEALCRAIEQHEAYKRELGAALRATSAACADHVKTIIQLKQELADFKEEVSNAVVCYFSGVELDTRLHRFIIPKPKPDPLVEVCKGIGFGHTDIGDMAENLSIALDALGFEIREKGQ
jgi:hypothetical protein